MCAQIYEYHQGCLPFPTATAMWPKHSRDLPRNWNRDLSVAYRLLISNVHTVCKKRVNEHRAIVLVSEAAGSVMVRVRVGLVLVRSQVTKSVLSSKRFQLR